MRRVVIVDDSPTSQLILEAAFRNHAGFDVVGVAGDAATGYTMVRRLVPDLVTIDLCMPYIDGSALLEMLSPLTATCKIVVSDLAATNIAMAARLQALGATSCLGKQELVQRPHAFFKTMVTACEQFEAGGRGDAPLPTLASDGRSHDASPIPRPSERLGIKIPADEEARPAALRRRRLNNAVREREFDLVTRFVAEETGFPICLLTFIDQDTLWVKSSFGLAATSVPRSDSFCNHMLVGPESFVVDNAATDPRFAANPMVAGAPGFRTYVGQAIVSGDGIRLGALCVGDTRVRPVTAGTTRKLAAMAEILSGMIDRGSALAA